MFILSPETEEKAERVSSWKSALALILGIVTNAILTKVEKSGKKADEE